MSKNLTQIAQNTINKIETVNIGTGIIYAGIMTKNENPGVYTKNISLYNRKEANKLFTILSRIENNQQNLAELIEPLNNIIEDYFNTNQTNILRKGYKNQINSVLDFVDHFIYGQKSTENIRDHTGKAFFEALIHTNAIKQSDVEKYQESYIKIEYPIFIRKLEYTLRNLGF